VEWKLAAVMVIRGDCGEDGGRDATGVCLLTQVLR